ARSLEAAVGAVGPPVVRALDRAADALERRAAVTAHVVEALEAAVLLAHDDHGPAGDVALQAHLGRGTDHLPLRGEDAVTLALEDRGVPVPPCRERLDHPRMRSTAAVQLGGGMKHDGSSERAIEQRCDRSTQRRATPSSTT